METLEFNKGEVKAITFDQLKETTTGKRTDYTPLHGIEHVDLIQSIYNMAHEYDLQPEISTIYAANTGPSNNPGVLAIPFEMRDGEVISYKYLIRRLLLSINLIALTNKGKGYLNFNSAIAISYHQNGLQIAWGENVKICKNLSIYGSRNLIGTYGDNKIGNVNHMLEHVRGWLAEGKAKHIQDAKIIKALNEVTVTYDQVRDFIGHLFIKRLRKDTKVETVKSKERSIPLNLSQINMFTESYLESYLPTENPINLYDLYNMGTNFQKPHIVDQTLIPEMAYKLGEDIIDFFAVEVI